MYEPYVQALGKYLLISIPPWFQVNVIPDNWQASTWDKLIADMPAQTHYSPILVTRQSNESTAIQQLVTSKSNDLASGAALEELN